MPAEHRFCAAAFSTGRSSSLGRVLQLHHAVSMLNDMQHCCIASAVYAAAGLHQLCMQCGISSDGMGQQTRGRVSSIHPQHAVALRSRPAASCVALPGVLIASCVAIIAFSHQSSTVPSRSTSLRRDRPRRCLRARLCIAAVYPLRLYISLEPSNVALRSGVLPAGESPHAAARAPPLLRLCHLQQCCDTVMVMMHAA